MHSPKKACVVYKIVILSAYKIDLGYCRKKLFNTIKGGGNVDIVRNLLVSAWKRYKNKRSEDKQEDRKAESKEGDGSLHNGSSGKESPPVSGPPCPSRKSLISAANCGAQDQIKTLLADPSIDVNEQSAKVISC